MATFSDRALSIQPTGVRKMFDLAGDDVISFGLGEPDFQPPDIAIEAFYQAMKDGHNKYTTTAGLPALRARIAESWAHLCPGLDESNVCMTMSGTNALLNIFGTLVDPGKNVLLPEPYFRQPKALPRLRLHFLPQMKTYPALRWLREKSFQ